MHSRSRSKNQPGGNSARSRSRNQPGCNSSRSHQRNNSDRSRSRNLSGYSDVDDGGHTKRIRTRGDIKRLNWKNLVPASVRNIIDISPHIIFLYDALDSWSIGNGRQEDASGFVKSLPLDQGIEVLKEELEAQRLERLLVVKLISQSAGGRHMMVLVLDKLSRSGVFYDPLGIYSSERIKFILKLLKFLTSYNVKYFCDRAQVPGTLECQRHCANFTCQVARVGGLTANSAPR